MRAIEGQWTFQCTIARYLEMWRMHTKHHANGDAF